MSETRFRILFSRGRGLLSRLVAWFVRSRLSHAAGSFTILRVDMVMESTEKGVDLLPARRFAADNIVEAVVRPVSGPLATEDGMVSHLSWLIERHGADKYDWMAAGSVGTSAISSTAAGIPPRSSHFAASAYRLPTERSDAVNAAISNHG